MKETRMEFLEAFRKFFLNHAQGRLSVMDNTGAICQLRQEDPDIWQLAQNATEFRCEGRRHSRAAFVKLMQNRMQPGNVFQVYLPVWMRV